MSIRTITKPFLRAIIITALTVYLIPSTVSAMEHARGGIWTFYKNKALALTESTGTWQEYYLSAPINQMDSDQQGVLWFATKKGVSRFAGKTWETFGPDNSRRGPFNDDQFLCLADGTGDTLWAGTSTGGLARFTDTAWTVYDTTDGLPCMKIISLLRGRDGTIWVGTADGLAAWRNGVFTSYPVGRCLPGGYVRSLTQDTRGTIWAECYSYTGLSLDEMKTGMCRFDGNGWTQYRFAFPITHVLPARSGLMWLVTRNRESGTSTLYAFTKRQWAAVDSTHLGINRLAADSSGRLWVATDGGLYGYDGKNWQGIPQTLGKQVTAVSVDSRNHVWCAYSDDNRSMFIGELDGTAWKICSLFPEKNIAVITETPDGLWFGASGGLIRYHKGAWRIYDELHPSVSVHIRDMVYQSGPDRLWAATEKGIAYRDGTGPWHAFVNRGLNQNHVYSANCGSTGVWINSYHWHRFDSTGWHPYNERYSYSPGGNPLEYASPGPDGTTWFWSADFPEVVLFNHGQLTAYPTLKKAVAAHKALITKEPAGSGNGLWLRTADAIWTIDRSTGLFSRSGTDSSWQDHIFSPIGAVRYAGDSLAVCSRYRLYLSGNGSDFRPCILPDHLRFRDIATGRHGSLWLESETEMVRTGSGECRIYPFPAARTAPARQYRWVPAAETLTVTGVAPDAAGRIWLATTRGAGYVEKGAFHWLKTKNRLPRRNLKSVICAADGVWVLHDFGTSVLHKRKWQHFTIKEGLISNLLHGAVTGKDGTLYFYAPYGISSYRNGIWTNQTVFGTASYPFVQDVYPGPEGNLTLATKTGLLTEKDGSWQRIGKAEGFLSEPVYAVTSLGNDTLMTATGTGIYKTVSGKIVHHARQPRCGFGSRFLSAPDGTVWLAVGTAGNTLIRLYRHTRGNWQEQFTELHLSCAAFDGSGRLILGSPGGIFIVDTP